MDPERGDPSVHVTADDVARALRAVGVTEGDTVHFHSSLSSMGTVVGGADAVIDGFLRVVGAGGTVAVPTLCQRHAARRFVDWDIDHSPSDVGRITEVFRHRPGAVRSDHPTHSVAAVGARADELTRDHRRAGGRPGPWGDAAFAAGSPWDKYYRWNAGVLFIGVGFNVNTMMHYIQSLIVERFLAPLPEPARASLASEVEGWLKAGIWPHYGDTQLEALRREAGIVRYGKIGSATLRHMRAAAMVDHALPILESEPERWFSPAFCLWYERARTEGRP